MIPGTCYLKIVLRHVPGEVFKWKRGDSDLAPHTQLTGGTGLAWISEGSAG